MLVSSRAIVLRTIKYSDSTLIVNAYTESGGRMSFAVRIPKTSHARLKSVLFAPGAALVVEWNEHGASSALPRIRSARPECVMPDIGGSPAKMAVCMFMLEVATATLRAPVADARMFEFLLTSLRLLDAERESCANFHIVFLLHMAELLGFRPDIDSYADGRWFDMADGRFTDHAPADPDLAVAPDEARHIPTLMRMRYNVAARLRIPRAQRARLLAGIISYYAIHVPAFPALKSPEILRELFD